MDEAPAAPLRRTFLDPVLETRFRTDGYVVLPFLTPEEVAALRSVWEEREETGTGFQTDFEREEPEHKEAVHAAVAPALQPRLDALFDRHRPFMTSFLAKWPGTDSSLYVHQDWAYVDESRFRSAVVWVALDDTSPELGNGPLQVLPGSHRVAGEHRGTRTTPWHADHPEAVRAGLVTVPARAGDAVIMDNALVHASPDNTASTVRLAVAVAVIPVEADLIHAAVDPDDGSLRTFTVDDRFFREQTPTTMRARIPDDLAPADLPHPHTWRSPDLALFARLAGTVDADDANARLGGSAPEPPAGNPAARALGTLLAVNHQRIADGCPDDGPFLATESFAWLEPLRAAWEDLAEEYRAATGAASGAASLRLLSGAELPNLGAWDALVLRDNLGWDATAVQQCPTTADLLRAVPGLRSAMFSVLGPWARIGGHRGANKGVLRAHVGVIVPGEPGRIALWAGDDQRSWAPGSAFVFDDTYEHRVANRTDGWRVSLMVEFDRPLTGADRLLNQVVQRAMRWTPQVRGSRERRDDIRRALSA